MKRHLNQTLLFLLSLCLPLIPACADDNNGMSVLVTGANRGLGLELTKQFLDDGYTVYGTARKPEEASDLKATGATVLQLDVTSEESIAALAKTLEGKPLDILINNAGYFGPNKIGEKMDTIHNLSRKEIELCHAVNTMGPLFIVQALLPNLEAGKTKKIINVSSRSGMLSRKGGGAMGYRLSKAGINMATVTLSSQLQKDGFIVVSVAPGHNKTDMGTDRGKMDPSKSMPMLKKVIEELKPKQSGGFWYYTGERLPW